MFESVLVVRVALQAVAGAGGVAVSVTADNADGDDEALISIAVGAVVDGAPPGILQASAMTAIIKMITKR